MVKPEKEAEVREYLDYLRNAKSIYLADYLGLDVAEITELRRKCRTESIRFSVVKNRLMRRAAAELGLEALGAYLAGPTAVAVSETDEVAPAKILAGFAKDKERPKLKAAVVDGVVYGPEAAAEFARFPSLTELRAKLLYVFSAPATQLVRVIAANGTQLARVLDARRDQLEKSGQ
jgi:large subunit ribosomal protein L10